MKEVEHVVDLKSVLIHYDRPQDFSYFAVEDVFEDSFVRMYDWLIENAIHYDLVWNESDVGDHYSLKGESSFWLEISIVFYKKAEAALFLLFHQDIKVFSRE